MTYEVNGRTLEATESGYLVNQDDWDKDVAQAIAAADGLSLTQDHWDVIEYLAQQPCHPQGDAGQVGWAQGGQQDAVRSFSGESVEAGGEGGGAAGEYEEGRVLRRVARADELYWSILAGRDLDNRPLSRCAIRRC
jgi:hypothetical protein